MKRRLIALLAVAAVGLAGVFALSAIRAQAPVRQPRITIPRPPAQQITIRLTPLQQLILQLGGARAQSTRWTAEVRRLELAIATEIQSLEDAVIISPTETGVK